MSQQSTRAVLTRLLENLGPQREVQHYLQHYGHASGAVAVLAGAHHLAIRTAKPVPAMSEPIHAAAPVAFPVILVPELLVIAVLYGATESAASWMAACAFGLALAAFWGRVGDGAATRGAARLLAAVLIVAGIALLVLGIRDV